MSTTPRRKFKADFKAKVALAAIKEQQTIEEICKKFEIHPTYFNQLKREFVNNAASLFDKENKELQVQDNKTLLQVLYAQIGQPKVENDFLKKIAVMPLHERCQMVGVEKCNLSIVKQCDLLSLHRSRYYYEPVLESAENLVIMHWLYEQYFDTPFYGVLRL